MKEKELKKLSEEKLADVSGGFVPEYESEADGKFIFEASVNDKALDISDEVEQSSGFPPKPYSRFRG